MRVAVLAISMALAGCGTVTPDPVHAFSVAYSGNVQNAGLIGVGPHGGYVLTPEAYGRYAALIREGYGRGFTPPLTQPVGVNLLPDGNYEMDKEHLVDFGVMASEKRSRIKSP